jgi:hypothetical protein
VKLFKYIKGSILYVRAGDFAERGDYRAAREAIDQASGLLGFALSKPSMFEFHLRAAEIYWRTGDVDSATQSLGLAIHGIRSYKRLKGGDTAYLLDYCDVFMHEIINRADVTELRLTPAEYDRVVPRYRRAYPLSPR